MGLTVNEFYYRYRNTALEPMRSHYSLSVLLSVEGLSRSYTLQ